MRSSTDACRSLLREKARYGRTLCARSALLVGSGMAMNCQFDAALQESEAKRVEGAMSYLNDTHNFIFYRVRIKDGHNAVGLLVSTAGKRCIPSTQFWLTVDACAAYRFPQDAALRVQVRLGDIGFTTVLEEIQD
jgi:hypothetical protein